MEFDPSSSSHAHLSILRPLTTQSAELAKLVETIGKDTTSNDENSTSRLRVDSSPKGVCVHTAQIHSRVGCAKSALYSTKCTLESGMCKKYSIQHKMYTREWDMQKVLYTAQNVRSRVRCAKAVIIHVRVCVCVWFGELKFLLFVVGM